MLHGREIEIDRFVNRHLTAAQRADVRNHEPGEFVIFHSRVPPLRVMEGDACRIDRVDGEFVYLSHPTGRTIRIRPGDNWVRYRFAVYETARIRIRPGDRIRWTANDKVRGLVNGGEAVVREIGTRRVRFELAEGKTLTLSRDDPQLRHIDHAWSSTVHAAQGMTRDAAIGVLDTGHGRLSGQAALYVEASRARDRFVLVTDNRETLAEALEENDGAGMTAREAVGEDDDPPPGAPGAVVGMLRELRDDWRALKARAETGDADLSRMEGYARVVTGVTAAEGHDLPADLAAFAAEVRGRDAEIVERRNRELAFVQQADRHCRTQPLLQWAAADAAGRCPSCPSTRNGRPTARRWRRPGAHCRKAGASPAGSRQRSGEYCAASGSTTPCGSGKTPLPTRRWRARRGSRPATWRGRRRSRNAREPSAGTVSRTICAGRSRPGAPAPPVPELARRGVEEDPLHEAAGRRIEGFLRDCRDHAGRGAALGRAEHGAPEHATLDGWLDRANELRRDGLRMLGEGAGARLDDPARIRLADAADERGRVRDAVDGLAEEALRLRAEAFVDLHHRVEDMASRAGCDPTDLAAWQSLRDRAEGLRDEPGLAPEAKEAARAVLAHDVRVEVETAPVADFLNAGARHLERRAGLEEQAHETGVEAVGLEGMQVWRETSAALRETAHRLLQGGDATETRAASRLESMPRLRDRVDEIFDRLESHEIHDRAAEFQAIAASVEARARERETLPLHAEGYGRATGMARALSEQEALPASVRREADAWLERDRGWQDELASVPALTGARGLEADPAERRAAAQLPAVAEAVRLETDRLAELPPLKEGIPWTGDVPLVAGDRIAFQAQGRTWQGAVVSPGVSGGMHDDDTLRLRVAEPGGRETPAGGRLYDFGAHALAGGNCVRAPWQDEGLRELELARQCSVPLGACRLPCPEPVPGDRIVWTEAAGPAGEVRTIEADVVALNTTRDGRALDLRVVRAAGPGAPEPGAAIGRTAGEVTARGCFRAPWADEARRERVLDPPRQEQSREQEQGLQQDRSQGRGFSM